MIGDLPDFRLETWFSRWEFAATHTFTASDAQTMSVAELLALAGRDVTDLADIDLGYRKLEHTFDRQTCLHPIRMSHRHVRRHHCESKGARSRGDSTGISHP